MRRWTIGGRRSPLGRLGLAQLRQRRSIKWRQYPPDVLPLWVAETDTPLAEPIATALTAAISRGDTGYAHPGGLYEAFAGFARRRYGWAVDPARMVMVPDVMRGVAEALRLLTEPGAGVLINTPAYPPFFAFIASAGRQVVQSPLAFDAGQPRLDIVALERDLARPEVRAYLLCNPHNPTGLVLTRDELIAVAELASRHGVAVVVDEIHAPLVYPHAIHIPFATIDSPAATGAVILVSASKAWNIPGLKTALAVAGGDASWTHLSQLPLEVMLGAGLLGVIASEAAFAECDDYLAGLLAGLDHNRRLLARLLTRHAPGVGYAPPQATYLAWLDFRDTGLGEDPGEVLLERGRVALSRGPTFGVPGHGFARLNFATSPALLEEGVRRIASALA